MIKHTSPIPSPLLYRIARSGLIYLLLSLGIVAFFCWDCMFRWNYLWRGTAFGMLLTVALWQGNGLLTNWLDTRISWVHAPGKRAVVGIVVMVLYSTLATLVVGGILYVGIFEVSLEVYLKEDFPGVLTSSLVITALIALTLNSSEFLSHWRESVRTAEKLKREKLAAQYSSLKSQLNPHFLFNSLNTLSALVYKDPDLSAKFIKGLSDIYRYVLDQAEKELVPLEQEQKFITSFIELLSIRFGRNLIAHIEIPQPEGFHLPPLTLQLLVENAVKHNIISQDKPLTLSITQEEGAYIRVSNTLQKRDRVHHSNGIGLENIRIRYSQLTDRTVEVTATADTFSVGIPLLTLESTPGENTNL